MKNIGIIGNGFVGSAILHGFILHTDHIYVYDKKKSVSNNTLKETIENSDIIFMCLPTPMQENGECDLSIIYGCFEEILSLQLNLKSKVFVIKSTVVPGTTVSLENKFPSLRFVFNPEFLTQRRSRLDFINTSRIILGGKEENLKILETLYRNRFPYTKIIKTDSKTAELIKYMCNCFFATKISFMNEMKQICDALETDWNTALDGFISDGRIGNSHIDVPGHDGNMGFGGKCFPKDLNALIKKSLNLGVDPKVMRAAWEKNLEVRKNLDWNEIEGATSKKSGDK